MRERDCVETGEEEKNNEMGIKTIGREIERERERNRKIKRKGKRKRKGFCRNRRKK